MSRAEAVTAILEPMQRVFLPPRDFDEAMQKSVLAEYAEALEQFGADDLRAAWVKVRNEHRTRAWPVIGVFVDAAGRSRLERETASGTAHAKQKHDNAVALRWKVWEQVRNTAKAKNAAREGVAWAFKCAVLSGVEPINIDIDNLIREQQRAEATALKIETDKELFSTRGHPIGVMKGESKRLALEMYAGLRLTEAETQQEVGITAEIGRPQIDIGSLVM